jgi:hypothetical protein
MGQPEHISSILSRVLEEIFKNWERRDSRLNDPEQGASHPGDRRALDEEKRDGKPTGREWPYRFSQ